MGLSKQQKLAKILEKKQLAVEAKKQRKRDELKRETEAHLLWKYDVEKKWQDVMLTFDIPVRRQQVEVIWHSFERTFDKKDGLINHLIYLRDIANFQYARTLGNFCIISENIINTFLTDLEIMCKKNNVDTAAVLKFGEDELAHYLANHNNAEQHLKLLLYTSHHSADSLVWNTRGDNMVKRDEYMSSYYEIRDTLTAILEGNYSYMWDVYKVTLRSYITKTRENQKQLRLIRKKDQMMADIIAAQAKELIISERVIKHLRNELVLYETGEKQAGFRDRRNRHREACNKLKTTMERSVEIDKNQICVLVKDSDDAVEWIAAAKKKSEKILRMAAQCRKYETQREKTMPYGSKTPLEPIKQHVRMHPEEDPMVYNTLVSTCGMNKLWQRISSAELSKRALIREKLLLERENAILERQLAEQKKENVYLTTFKCACAKPKDLRKPSTRLNAVEGALEIRKVIL